jgi:hypothetical protein
MLSVVVPMASTPRAEIALGELTPALSTVVSLIFLHSPLTIAYDELTGPSLHSQNFGGGEISTSFQACPGSSYTFSAAVAMEPGSTGSCTVQMYLYEVGTANPSPVQDIGQAWGGVSFTFIVPTDVTCCSTNVVLDFVCTNLEPENGSTPWVGFDNFAIS